MRKLAGRQGGRGAAHLLPLLPSKEWIACHGVFRFALRLRIGSATFNADGTVTAVDEIVVPPGDVQATAPASATPVDPPCAGSGTSGSSPA